MNPPLTKRYDDLFKQLGDNNQGAFIPFVTLGDPGKEASLAIIRTLIEAGADALELGIPFSDPIADGPTIQAANIRALAADITPADCFDIIKTIREEYPLIPIGLLLYSNLVMARGISTFYETAASAGVDSVLVADVPVRESKPFRQAALANGIAPIFICAPNTHDDTIRQLASYGRGYTYLLSRSGVTGAEVEVEMPADELVSKLKLYHAAPPVLGFGISTPEHVKDAINAGAAGAISGSAIVKIIEQTLDDSAATREQLTHFVQQMKAATAIN